MEVDSAGDARPAAEERAAAGEAPGAAAPKDPFVDAMLAPSLTRTANGAATFAVSVCGQPAVGNTPLDGAVYASSLRRLACEVHVREVPHTVL